MGGEGAGLSSCQDWAGEGFDQGEVLPLHRALVS